MTQVEAEFFDLWTAETADDLRRVLVIHPPIRRSANDFEPFLLLSKHHDIDPAGSVVNAMLLVTDPRWSGAAGSLARRIEESGMVADDELDLLAEAFLAADDALYWAMPDDWFSEEGIVIGEVGDAAPEDSGDDGPAVARREVVPPLRRWAAGRLVRRQPERWGALHRRARHLDARSAAAVVSGLIDAIEVLTAATQEFLIGEAVRWPQVSVRRQGIGLVAERQGAEAAHALAARDASAGVRAWGEKLLHPRVTPERTAKPRPQAPERPAKTPSREPPTLF